MATRDSYILQFWKKYMQPADVMACVFAIELLKGMYAITMDDFREGDYTSYVEQSAQFLEGERDLTQITGKNGPCLYPALHVYTYALFYKLTGIDEPELIYAKGINLIIHLVICAFAVKIYSRAFGSKSQAKWLIVLCCLNTKLIVNSVRKCFAEPINVMFVYMAIYCYQRRSNVLGSLLIAVAMGFKMSVLLYIPAVYYIVSKSQGIGIGTLHVIVIYLLQELWAIPFTNEYGPEYRITAFKFDRKFSINQSITFNWISYSPFFHSNIFNTILLLFHVGLLVYVLFTKWLPLLDDDKKFRFSSVFRELGIWPIRPCFSYQEQDPCHVAEVFFVCNFIGCACARTLHQQFIVWYWFSIPFMMYSALSENRLGIRILAISMILLNAAFTMVTSILFSLVALTVNWSYIYHIVKSKSIGQQVEEKNVERLLKQ